MRGKATRLRLDSHSRACFRLRHRPASVPTHARQLRRRGGCPGCGASPKAGLRPDGRACVWRGLLSGLGQQDQGEAAESDLAPTATGGEPVNPSACAAGLDKEVGPLPPACLPGGADERGRMGLLGMAPVGLVLVSRRAEMFTATIPSLQGGWQWISRDDASGWNCWKAEI